MNNINKICPVCGEEFSGRGNKKYCSYKCRQKAIAENRKEQRKEYYKANAEKYRKYQRNHKVEKQEQEKICPICGKVFTTHDSRQKYCSLECREQAERNAAQRFNDAKRIVLEKICPICGKVFTTTDSKKIYCGDECIRKNAALRERKKSENPEFRKEHSARTIIYQQKVKELGMTMTEFKKFKAAGGDVEAYMAQRLNDVTHICPKCGKEFVSYDGRVIYCEDCRNKR